MYIYKNNRRIMDNFDLKKFLVENRLTTNSRQVQEGWATNLAAGAAMALGTLGAHGQEAPKQTDTKTVAQSMFGTPEQRAAAKAKRDAHVKTLDDKQKKRIDFWISMNPGMTEKDYWKEQDRISKLPDPGLELNRHGSTGNSGNAPKSPCKGGKCTGLN